MKNQLLRKGIATILLVFLIAFFSTMFVSCGSMKKHKEKEKTEQIATTNLDSSSVLKSKNSTKENQEVTNNTDTRIDELEVDVKNGDSLEITSYDKNGNVKESWKFKGSGSAKKKSTSKKETHNSKKEIKSKTELTKKKIFQGRTYAKKASLKKAKEKENKGSVFCTYLFWIILIIIIVILWYLNKRFKWLFWLSNVFSKFFGM